MHVVPESEVNLLLAHVPPKVTWEEFRSVRNGIVMALVPFGSVGPSGVHDDNDEELLNYGKIDATFFVVEDMYNDEQRLHLIETNAEQITEPLLEALSHALSRDPEWAAHVALGAAALYVFADRVIGCGRRFWDCESVEDIVMRCGAPVKFGDAPVSWADGYAIWRDLVCGEWHCTDLPVAPDRQWTYILSHLSQTKRISEFTYRNRVLHELHPTTRLEFVSRFLEEYGAGREVSAVGLETVAYDSGDLLAFLDDAVGEKLLRQLAAGQAKLPHKEAFYFWTRVVSDREQRAAKMEAPHELVASFLLARMSPPTPAIISLSALLGLACMKHATVAEQAAHLLRQARPWSASVRAWLLKLNKGLRAYPYPPHDIDLSSLP